MNIRKSAAIFVTSIILFVFSVGIGWANQCIDASGNYVYQANDVHCDYAYFDFLGRPDINNYGESKYNGLEQNLTDQYWDDYIDGVDLGMSVWTGQQTVFFFGDVWPVEDNGQYLYMKKYGLPWGGGYAQDYELTLLVNDLGNDVIYSMSDYYNYPFPPIYNTLEWQYEALYGMSEFPFWVPTGTFWDDQNERIYLWYGKYIDNANCDRSYLLYYDADTEQWAEKGAFADRKFIQIAAVPITVSSANPADLPITNPNGEQGVLIYGTGQDVVSYSNSATHPILCYGESFFDQIEQIFAQKSSYTSGYRKSNVYLAYISLTNLASTSYHQYIYYRTSNGWSTDLDDAAPIFPKDYVLGGVGEFSVMKVPNTNLLMMVYSTRSGLLSVKYTVRFADLSDDPADFSCGGASMFSGTLYGYGDYIIPRSVEMVYEGSPARYHLYYDRVVSFWDGFGATNYGTAVIQSVINFSQVLSECQ